MEFKLISKFKPTGDQPQAIKKLTRGILRNQKHQTLLGITGSGKTYTIASVIEKTQKPTLIVSHNKTLAAQLYQEFKEFFPENSAHYFVSYYDYYQPEAYIPQTDTYIAKDAKINQEIDRLRHETVQSLQERKDIIVVASVSCIYNIGSPLDYQNLSLALKEKQRISRSQFLRHLINLQYERRDYDFKPGSFRVRGEIIEIWPSSGKEILRIEMWSDKIESIYQSFFSLEKNGGNLKKNIILSNKRIYNKIKEAAIFPAKFWLAPQEKINLAMENIKSELQERIVFLKKRNQFLEAQRLKEKTNFDLEMLKESGYCHGIENYSRHLDFRKPGEPPFVLIDHFPKDYLLIIDESHITLPQLRAMYNGDRQRKGTLIEYGFRLPSALDNRPLKFEEFEKKIERVVYISATPSDYEKEKSKKIIEQIIRPTYILDPLIEVKPAKNQLRDLINEIKKRTRKKERVLVTTLTKRLAEELSEYLKEAGIKSHYLHSEIKTLERPEILRDLRKGKYDVIVGINLLREGLDLPEVSLVAILDADKEGFLRNETSLIQTTGRAARHIQGKVIMYADRLTRSMKIALEETERRRKIQRDFNKIHRLKPKPIKKEIRKAIIETRKEEIFSPKELEKIAQNPYLKEYLEELREKMELAAKNMQFEEAAIWRDKIRQLKSAKIFPKIQAD